MIFEQAYLQVYTGNGKGKTTAAVGLGLRAAGAGGRVLMIQFMKGRRYGELEILRGVANFEVQQHGRDEFVRRDRPDLQDIDLARQGLAAARTAIMSSNYDLVILDELNVALDFKLVSLEEVVALLQARPRQVELVLTGRYAPPEILALADLVTEMREVRHFYARGVQARPGIEY